MEDRDFFDHLYSLWAKTTGAEDCYWMPADDPNEHVRWQVFAVPQEGDHKWIGSFHKDEDADFITAVHGCLPDLVKRLHMAVDEADRLDFDRDSQECRIAELEQEILELKGKV